MTQDGHDETQSGGTLKRRGLIAGAAALVAAAIAKSAAQPAEAAVVAMTTDTMNPVAAVTGVTGTVTGAPAWRSQNNASPAATDTTADGIQGFASAAQTAGVFGRNDGGVGVWGETANGYGVFGDSVAGYGGFFQGGYATLLLQPGGPTPGATPPTGAHLKGEVFVGTDGTIYFAIANGSTLATWRKLAGPTTAGSLHVLPTPDRYVDTRAGGGNRGGVTGPLPVNTTKVYQITGVAGAAGVTIPAGAIAIVGTLTTVGTAASLPGSFLTIWQGGTQPPVSNVNYGPPPSDILATQFVSALSTDGKVSVFNRSDANYLVDVVGYYL